MLGGEREMYFKKGELIEYPDKRAFVVREAKEKWASVTERLKALIHVRCALGTISLK